MIDDLIAIVTSFSGRIHGQRAHKNKKKKERKGKTFVCGYCQSLSGSPRQLDSDLNAARNIAIAPLPLSHWRKKKPPVLGTP